MYAGDNVIVADSNY